MIIDKLKDNTILVVDNNIKSRVIESIRSSNRIRDIKFMSLDELRSRYYFSYDERAIYYLINKYNYKYDVALKYLNNLYYVDKDYYDNYKLDKLVILKKELIDNDLLLFNKLFVSSLKNRNIIIYNYGLLSKYDMKFINELKRSCNVEIYNDSLGKYKHDFVYQFNNIEEEVEFVAGKICSLISDGVDINKIKLCGINDEYNNIIKKIFSFYNIPITFNNSSLFATSIGKAFLDNLNSDVKVTLKYIEDRYNLCDEGIINIYNSIVNIVNKYVWCDDIVRAKDLIINDFKKKKINVVENTCEVKVINDLGSASEDDYVFLMSFNQGIIPKVYKDEDYLSDKEKEFLGIDTTVDLNKNSYSKWCNDIRRHNNLIITYKLSGPGGEYYLSSLNDDLGLEIKKEKSNYNYSNIYNKIKLTYDIDNLVKYNIESKDMAMLYNNYKNINYMAYDNKYVKINRELFNKYMDKKLVLSYSAINNYYHCSFRYYLSNILKLNIYEETFYTILGNLFHYILSICFDKDIDIGVEYKKYIDRQSYEFNERELFFLDNLLEELKFIIDTIRKQYEYSSLNNAFYEERIEVDKSKNDMMIIFKGFVDKILVDNDKTVASIIDYKTGSPDLNLNNSIHGLDLQLPVYIYLVKKKFPSIRIVGFYLQKILNNEISIDNKHSYLELKEEKLKLQGYTNKDENLIREFDDNYSNSKVIKGMRTTSKGLGSKKVLGDIEIDKLNSIVEDKIDEVIDGILERNFDINPKRVGVNNIGCKYCSCKDICFMSEENIVNLKEYKNMEFLEEI